MSTIYCIALQPFSVCARTSSVPSTDLEQCFQSKLFCFSNLVPLLPQGFTLSFKSLETESHLCAHFNRHTTLPLNHWTTLGKLPINTFGTTSLDSVICFVFFNIPQFRGRLKHCETPICTFSLRLSQAVKKQFFQLGLIQIGSQLPADYSSHSALTFLGQTTQDNVIASLPATERIKFEKFSNVSGKAAPRRPSLCRLTVKHLHRVRSTFIKR